MNRPDSNQGRPLPRTLTIAQFAVLEAVRTRLPWLWVGVLAFVGAASFFIDQIAITESDRLQWSFYASAGRLAAVLTLALYVTSSIVRELNEKGLEMVLALDLPRASYVGGKLAGFVLIGAVMALLVALPLALARPIPVVAVWAASLFCELALIAAFALFCALSLGQVASAFALITGFYLLARCIDALRLMSGSALLGDLGGARSVFEYGFGAIALLLPALDRFTLTEWIVATNVDSAVLMPIVMQSAVYALLLLGASLVEFHRREL